MEGSQKFGLTGGGNLDERAFSGPKPAKMEGQQLRQIKGDPQSLHETSSEMMVVADSGRPQGGREARHQLQQEIQEKNRQLIAKMRHDCRFIWWPTYSRVQDWELVLFVALFYTFLMTPFQVAFLASTPISIFVLNRIVDVLLCIDMFLVFFIAVEVETETGRKKWETSLSSIRWKYFKTFFIVDTLGLLSSAVEFVEYSGTPMSTAGPAKAARVLRVIRLIRILRMARLAAISREVQRIVEDWIPSKEAKFITIEIMKWFLKSFLIGHVMACVWGFTMTIEEGQDWATGTSWLQQYEHITGHQFSRTDDVASIYMLALYWSFTTLVTVGYGDIVPWTLSEHIVCLVLMLIASIVWPMMMGTICSVVGCLDAERLQFGLDMDHLVAICNDRKLPAALREKLRSYMARKSKLKRLQNQQDLMQSFSPVLRGEVALSVGREFLDTVPWLQLSPSSDKRHRSLLRQLAEDLEMFAISPEEWVVPADMEQYVHTVRVLAHDVKHGSGPDEVGATHAQTPDNDTKFILHGYLPRSRNLVAPLTFLDSGVAVLDFVRLAPCFWHEDMILTSPMFRNLQVARAVVFCTIYVLRQSVLQSALGDGFYSDVERQVRKRATQLAGCRIMKDAAKVCREAPAHEDFVPKEDRQSFSLVEAVNKALSKGEEEEQENVIQVSKEQKILIEHVVNKAVVADSSPKEKPASWQDLQKMLEEMTATQAALERKLFGHTLDS